MLHIIIIQWYNNLLKVWNVQSNSQYFFLQKNENYNKIRYILKGIFDNNSLGEIKYQLKAKQEVLPVLLKVRSCQIWRLLFGDDSGWQRFCLVQAWSTISPSVKKKIDW